MPLFSQLDIRWFVARLGASLVIILLPLLSFGQATYTWRPASGSPTSWTEAANWDPARTAPGPTDILVFNGAVTPTATVTVNFAETAGQTIGQLQFIGGVQATLNNNANRTLAVGNGTDVGVLVAAGTLVRVAGTNTTGSSGLTIALSSGTRARIEGRLEFSGPAGATTVFNSTHKLMATTTGAIEFVAGSYFQASSGFANYAFGGAAANRGSVIFQAGATYEQVSGATPFGDSGANVTEFRAGSAFRYAIPATSSINSNFAATGRTYGNVLLASDRSIGATGAGSLTILNDFTVAAGTVNVSVATVTLAGNIIITGGSLAFTGNTLVLNGTASQSIGGPAASALTLNNLTLNNGAGLTLQRPVTVGGTLALTRGLLTTTATNSLTVGGEISGGSATSFVRGGLARQSSAAAPASLTFPIGKGSAYRPLTLSLTASPAGATTYTVEQLEGSPVSGPLVSPLTRISNIRSYQLQANNADFSGTLTVSFGADDQVTSPADPDLVVARNTDAVWVSSGHAAHTGTTLTSNEFTGGGTFALGSTASRTQNPLPVSLTSFVAERLGAGVRLRWSTASEENNERFEVQRSLTGQQFMTLGTVAGQGTTMQPQAYRYLDAQPDAGALYYRLRQIDTDGTSVFSPVLVVQPAAGKVVLFPNPAQAELTLQVPVGVTRYRVVNTLGQQLLSGPALRGTTQLDLHQLPPGSYYLELTYDSYKEVHKFFKSGN